MHTQTSAEFNTRWAAENAVLFVKRIREFAENHPSGEWDHAVVFSRSGNFVTFTAKRKGA